MVGDPHGSLWSGKLMGTQHAGYVIPVKDAVIDDPGEVTSGSG
jgi:hypothetical protein